MAGSLRVAWFLQTGLMLLAWPVAAQERLGQLSTNLSGTVSSGYTADYGNQTGSDHSWTVGGAANLSGFFYTPNFLSFTVSPYLNQSRANSNFQSISDASGINVSANIFGGSHFPGSISYSKAYDSEGSYAVPGIANYVTHGNSDSFGINWSENLPDAPSFSAGFHSSSGGYSVYGTDDQGQSASRSLNLHSGYRFAGFNMGAYFSTGDGHSLIPQILSGQQATEIHSGNTAYGFNVTHQLPLKGSVAASLNRSDWNTSYLGSTSTGTIDTFDALASVHPTGKFSVSASADYSDNLSGQLFQALAAAGGAVSAANTNQSSNSLDLMAVASYAPLQNLQATAFAERRTQTFLGETYGVRSFGGSATYGRKFLSGVFNAAATLSANLSDNNGEDTMGLSTTENYSREIFGWDVTGSFAYAQNVQTLLVTYMNSLFNYSANARRRWGNLNVSAGASASRTGLTQQAGAVNSSESYNASAGYSPWLTATGTYSKSNGQALATGAGLVPVPVPTPLLPSSLISLFGGSSYSFGVSSAPIKKLVLTASYASSESNTSSNAVSSTNLNNEFNGLAQYQYRKLTVIGGYSRLKQGFSGSASAPEVLSSFYMGVSRWFNFF